MSEPTSVPQPFERRPATAPAAGDEARIGCGKPLLVGCGLVLLLLAVASVILVRNAGRIFHWGLSQTQRTIEAALPADLERAERERLAAAFAATAAAVAEKRVKPDGLRTLRLALATAIAKAQQQQLEREDVRELTRSLEEVAGAAPSSQRDPATAPGTAAG